MNSLSSPTKTDIKKISTNTKPISSSTNETKQSKLTITIPIAKPKTQSTNSTVIQSVKKTNLTPSTKDEKKKLPDTKSISIKTEPKSIPSSITKKPLISSSKTSQIPKAIQQPKPSSNESVKPIGNKTPSSVLPYKPKTTQSQTSTNNNNNKERSGVSKPTSSSSSSTIDARQVKSAKFNSSSTKTISQERSASAPIKKTKPTIQEETITKPISTAPTMRIPKISSKNDPT